jgi:hypothetical protein
MWWLLASVHAAPLPDSAVYRVGAVMGSAERVLTSEIEVAVEHAGGKHWTFAVRRSLTTVEGGETWRFDSAAPQPTDPWPVSQQHAIAAVPVRILVDALGRPSAVADPGWQETALAALAALPLPASAAASGEALVDEAGIIEGYARDFPGYPPKNGAWVRPERVAGVLAQRTETCTTAADDGQTVIQCAGTVEAPALQGGVSRTELTYDRHGLVRMDTSWEATVLVGAERRPTFVGARRRVQRQGEPE